MAGWRTGIVLAVSDLGPLRPLVRGEPGARYVSFGWGNRRFYMSSHPGSGVAIAALEYAHWPVRAAGVLFSGQVDGRLSGLRACPAPQ